MKRIICTVLSTLALTATLSAKIQVTVWSGDVDVDITLNNIHLTVNEDSVVFVKSDPNLTTDAIGDITIEIPNANHSLDIYLRGPSGDPFTWGNSVESIYHDEWQTGWTTLKEARITGDLGGSSQHDEAILVRRIETLYVTGDVDNPVISASDSLIDMIVEGDLLADVMVWQFNLESLVVVGDIGAPGNEVKVQVNKDIGFLKAKRAWAEVSAGPTNDGSLRRMQIGDYNYSGDFVGSVHAAYVGDGSGIYIWGDLDGDVNVTSNVNKPIIVEGDFKAGRAIDIGNNLTDNATHNGMIQIDGMMLGDIMIGNDARGQISIGGDAQGDITITGDLNDDPDNNGRISIAGNGTGDITVGGNDDGHIGIHGDMSGAIAVGGNVTQPIEIGDDTDQGSEYLNGPITIGGDIDDTGSDNGLINVFGTMTTLGSIDIDGSLKGDLRFYDPQGLEGQVIIGANGDLNDIWDGTVHVEWDDISKEWIYEIEPYYATQPYKAPYYEVLKADLGGGAVGLVPFNFHKIECNPDHKQSLNQYTSPTVVTIWHYGPIYQPDSQTPLNVYRYPLPLPLNPPPIELWELITDQCSFDFDYTDPKRTITVSLTAGGRFPPSYVYRFKPNGAHLKCDLGLDASDPDVVYNEPDTDNAYQFTVGLTFDRNGDGLLNATDLALWQASKADLNNDALVDANDLADLLNAIAGG